MVGVNTKNRAANTVGCLHYGMGTLVPTNRMEDRHPYVSEYSATWTECLTASRWGRCVFCLDVPFPTVRPASALQSKRGKSSDFRPVFSPGLTCQRHEQCRTARVFYSTERLGKIHLGHGPVETPEVLSDVCATKSCSLCSLRSSRFKARGNPPQRMQKAQSTAPPTTLVPA